MIILYLLMGVFHVYQEGKQSQERDCVAKIGHKVRFAPDLKYRLKR